MKKTLITENNVGNYIKDGQLIVGSKLIVSPGVFDILRNQDIKVVYSDQDELENNMPEDAIEEVIREILKKEYNMVNSSVIDNVSRSVVNIINNK